jgi:murein DD-endopeptidase MepM/ murein hydrolase activator NlpD
MKYPKPIKPMVITQPWGVYRPDVYQQFGFTRHNGADYGDTKKMGNGTGIVSSPLDGIVVRVGYQPQGGGNFVSLCDGFNLFDFMHCESILVQEGQRVEVGQPVAIQDNTGFSTGPHTHIQMRPVDNWDGFQKWTFIMNNDANNSADPENYWTEDHAEDIWKLKQQVGILKKLVELYKKIQNK